MCYKFFRGECKLIYISVLNYKNVRDTIPCLDSLLKLQNVNYRILLVDNASPDNSYELLTKYQQEHADKIKLFEAKENRGYAAGNNIALRYALQQKDMDYCWILNNDTLVEPNALEMLVKYMDVHTDVGLCGSKLVYEWDHSKIQGYGATYHPWLGSTTACTDLKYISRIDCVLGASVFIRRSFLEDVGLMEEKYFLYYEEVDWALRARGKYKISCQPKSIVYHKEGGTIGASDAHVNEKPLYADFYSLRNRIWITKKFFPWFLPTVYLGFIGVIINRIRRKQFSRIPMILRIMLGLQKSII